MLVKNDSLMSYPAAWGDESSLLSVGRTFMIR